MKSISQPIINEAIRSAVETLINELHDAPDQAYAVSRLESGAPSRNYTVTVARGDKPGLDVAVLLQEMLTALDILMMGQKLHQEEYDALSKTAIYYIETIAGTEAVWEALGPVLDHVGPEALGD